jgi:hypothetical protein
MYARNQDRDTATNWATPQAQYDAVCNWGVPDHIALQRVSAIKHPVFVANGDNDPMILPHYSYLLAGLIPQAKVKIYQTPHTGSCSSTTQSSPPTSRPSSAHLASPGRFACAGPARSRGMRRDMCQRRHTAGRPLFQDQSRLRDRGGRSGPGNVCADRH